MPRHGGTAVLSEDGVYRYKLAGRIGPEQPLISSIIQPLPILWIMLNPSTADAQTDDATIRTITMFSELWGYNELLVGNLYAYRATEPNDLVAAWRSGQDIVGAENDAHLHEMMSIVQNYGGRVMAAWGAPNFPKKMHDKTHAAQAGWVIERARQLSTSLYCLKTTKDGSPVHPLYQPHRLMPVIWKDVT